MVLGVLCGLKDMCILMFVVIFGYWGIGFLIGYWFVFYVGLGVCGLWWGFVVGFVSVVVLMVWCFYCKIFLFIVMVC